MAYSKKYKKLFDLLDAFGFVVGKAYSTDDDTTWETRRATAKKAISDRVAEGFVPIGAVWKGWFYDLLFLGVAVNDLPGAEPLTIEHLKERIIVAARGAGLFVMRSSDGIDDVRKERLVIAEQSSAFDGKYLDGYERVVECAGKEGLDDEFVAALRGD